MTVDNTPFNASELCSRKLWQIISTPESETGACDLRAAVAELAARRHYLEELEEIGQLKR
jgi:hypothetical protein